METAPKQPGRPFDGRVPWQGDALFLRSFKGFFKGFFKGSLKGSFRDPYGFLSRGLGTRLQVLKSLFQPRVFGSVHFPRPNHCSRKFGIPVIIAITVIAHVISIITHTTNTSTAIIHSITCGRRLSFQGLGIACLPRLDAKRLSLHVTSDRKPACWMHATSRNAAGKH